MSDQNKLNFDYIGDAAWNDYAECFGSHWEGCPFQSDLLAALGGERNLAFVMWYHLQHQTLDSLKEPWASLDGLTPCDCVQSEHGVRQLRQALMEFPYP